MSEPSDRNSGRSFFLWSHRINFITGWSFIFRGMRRRKFPLVCLWVTASDLKLRRYEYFLRVHSRSGKRNSSQFSLSLNSHNAFRRLKETDFHLPSFAPFPCWRKVWETRVCANLKLIKFHNSTRRYFNLSRSRFLSVCGSKLSAVFDGDKLLRTTSKPQLTFSSPAIHRKERIFPYFLQILAFFSWIAIKVEFPLLLINFETYSGGIVRQQYYSIDWVSTTLLR